MISPWRRKPLWSVANEVRRVVEPSDLGQKVVHYSIPAVDATGTGKLEDSGEIRSAKLLLDGGEVLISKLNPRKSRVVHVLKSDYPKVSSTEFIGLRAGAELCPDFLAYYLQSETVRQELDSQVQSVTRSHQRVAPEDVLRLAALLPDIGEQRRIADFLDAETSRIDRIVEASRRLLHVLAERRSAGVVHAVSGTDSAIGAVGAGAIESSLPWLTSIPEDWAEVRLSLVARMGSGHTPSRARPDWWVDCTIPWVTTGEVQQMRDDRLEVLTATREKISRVGLANSAAELHPKGTVVLCRTAASAGYSAVMGTDMATSQDLVTWTCGPRLDPFYLLWCLRAMRRDLLGRLAMGSTHKTIYVPDLQALKIPLPPLEKQREIVRRVRLANRRIDGAVDGTRRRIELLSERRQALITAAVTGQFDVSTASGRNTIQGV